MNADRFPTEETDAAFFGIPSEREMSPELPAEFWPSEVSDAALFGVPSERYMLPAQSSRTAHTADADITTPRHAHISNSGRVIPLRSVVTLDGRGGISYLSPALRNRTDRDSPPHTTRNEDK